MPGRSKDFEKLDVTGKREMPLRGDSVQVGRTRLKPGRTRLEFVVVATRTRQTHQNQQFFFLVSLLSLMNPVG